MTPLAIAADETPAFRTRQRRPEQSIEPMLPTFQEDGHRTEPVTSWAEAGDRLLERAGTRALVRGAIADLPESYRVVLGAA